MTAAALAAAYLAGAASYRIVQIALERHNEAERASILELRRRRDHLHNHRRTIECVGPRRYPYLPRDYSHLKERHALSREIADLEAYIERHR